MPGIISEVKVREGQQVELGDTIVVIEAMTMENPIRAPRSAIVSAVKVAKGQEVQGGAVLVEFS
jgi:acetyl-CoA/propionyl-CoA carboxylase biotin carboxyl carrier protein